MHTGVIDPCVSDPHPLRGVGRSTSGAPERNYPFRDRKEGIEHECSDHLTLLLVIIRVVQRLMRHSAEPRIGKLFHRAPVANPPITALYPAIEAEIRSLVGPDDKQCHWLLQVTYQIRYDCCAVDQL